MQSLVARKPLKSAHNVRCRSVPQMVEETVHVRKSVPQSGVVRDRELAPLCLTGFAPL